MNRIVLVEVMSSCNWPVDAFQAELSAANAENRIRKKPQAHNRNYFKNVVDAEMMLENLCHTLCDFRCRWENSIKENFVTV